MLWRTSIRLAFAYYNFNLLVPTITLLTLLGFTRTTSRPPVNGFDESVIARVIKPETLSYAIFERRQGDVPSPTRPYG